MFPTLRPAALVSAALVLSVLLAGCGGGESGGGSGGNGGQQDGGGGQQESKGQAREIKIALGKIARVNPENNRRIVLRPNTAAQEQDGGSMVFKLRKNARIALGGQQAEVGDIKKGQQANIEYVVENDVNRALAVELFEAGNGGNAPN